MFIASGLMPERLIHTPEQRVRKGDVLYSYCSNVKSPAVLTAGLHHKFIH
jgi:hypothetical protein